MIVKLNDGRWRIDYFWRDERGKRCRKRWTIGPFATGGAQLAKRYLIDRIHEFQHGKHFAYAEVPTFKEAAEQWFNEHSKRYKVSWWHDAIFIKRLNQYLGDMRINRIADTHVRNFRDWLGQKGFASLRVNRHHQVLKTILYFAYKKHNINLRNPACDVKLADESDRIRKRRLSTEERIALLEACEKVDKELHAIVLFDLDTGLRMKELRELTWENVNLRLKQVFVKTAKGGKDRFVPLSEAAHGMLVQRAKASGKVFDFTNVRKLWLRAVKLSGIKDVRPHDLRRTFGSEVTMATRGDLRAVQHLLGHSSFTVTERVYSHLSPSHLRGAIEAYEAKIKQATAETVYTPVYTPPVDRPSVESTESNICVENSDVLESFRGVEQPGSSRGS